MAESTIVLQEIDLEKKIVILSLNRPKLLNALNDAMLYELRDVLERLSKKQLGALIINSQINRAFCAGIDVKAVQQMTNSEAAHYFAHIAETLEYLSTFSCPTVAVINGHAFGAGADLALACDIRVGGYSSAFRFPGPQFGVVLGTHRLVNEVGSSLARKIALTNELIDSKKALQYGIIHEIVEEHEALEQGITIAKKLTRIPQHTFNSIQEICSKAILQNGNYGFTPADYAYKSVEEGDFQERFAGYISEMKKAKGECDAGNESST